MDSCESSSKGGEYILESSIGQPDGGVATSGDYVISGGIWEGGIIAFANNFLPYLPLILH